MVKRQSAWVVAAIGIIGDYTMMGKSSSSARHHRHVVVARHYQEEQMDSRESALWARLKANRWAYTLTILATLSLGILIGTVISYGVKGKEGQKSSDATPLTIPAPQQLSNTFSQISKQLEPSVVNINTESTIKNPHHRRGSARPDPDQDDQGGQGGQGGDDSPFQDFFD